MRDIRGSMRSAMIFPGTDDRAEPGLCTVGGDQNAEGLIVHRSLSKSEARPYTGLLRGVHPQTNAILVPAPSCQGACIAR